MLAAGKEVQDNSSQGFLLQLVLVVLVGLGVTAVGFRHFVALDEQAVHRHLEQGTDTLISIVNPPVAFPNPALDELFSTLEDIRQAVVPEFPVTPDFLQGYLWETPMPGLDTSSLEYIPRISRTDMQERGNLQARFGDTLPADFNILVDNGDTLEPAPARDDYFPLLIEAGYDDFGETIGQDRYLDNPMIQIAMDKARDSADFIPYSMFPVVGRGDQTMVSRYFYAIYDSTVVPETVEERRNSLRGFVSVASFYPTEAFAGFYPESYQGIEASYFPAPGADLAGEGNPAVEAEMARGRLVETPYNLITDNNAPWVAMTRVTPEAVASYTTNNRWWMLFLGLVATAWLASLVIHYRRQTARIQAKVQRKTLDLQRRTEKLARVNEALERSEYRYRMLAENVSDVIYSLDLDGVCTYVSPSVTQQTGFAEQDYLGRSMADFLAPQSAEKIAPLLERARQLATGYRQQQKSIGVVECDMVCRDGSTLATENRLSLVRDDTGQHTGLLCVSRDITERKQSESEKQDLEEAYHHSQKMEAIGTLAGGIAHDFNNLLTGILGHAELLKMTLPENEEAMQGLSVIEKAAMRGKDLTGQLLGFARKGRYREVAVNLNQAIEEVCALLDRTIDKKIVVRCLPGDEAPMVSGDPGQLNQLILNLAVNALDAMPDGGELSIVAGIDDVTDNGNRQLDLAPGRYAFVEVRDTGIGMSPELMLHIFEPYFTDKDDVTHTGMGLAMVYGVAKNHGGAIHVESREGEGSRFKLYLPFVHREETREERQGGQDLQEKEGSILVVDDEKLVRDMAGTMLDKLGYRVELAADGHEAVDYYRDHWQSIDLVIVDMIMPTMGGIDCVQALKAINPVVNVIITTGYSQDRLAEDMQREKIDGFLQKPFRMDDLSALVESVMH